jgi:uncharacterized damage-inducible protein DinB
MRGLFFKHYLFGFRYANSKIFTTMTTNVQTLLQQLESQRLELMKELSNHDNTKLNKRPSPEAWSVTQTLLHLMTAETASIAYIRKKLSFNGPIPKAGVKSKFRRFTLWLAFALPLKYKAPKNLEVFPDFTDFNELKNKWAAQRLDLQSFIASLPDNILESEIWRHQVAGKMTIAQMLDFFQDHVKRHQKQIQRTLKTVNC